MTNETLRALLAKVLARPDVPLPLVPAIADLLKLDAEFNEGFLQLKEASSLEALEAALEVGDAVYKNVAEAVAGIDKRGDYSALERVVPASSAEYERLKVAAPNV